MKVSWWPSDQLEMHPLDQRRQSLTLTPTRTQPTPLVSSPWVPCGRPDAPFVPCSPESAPDCASADVVVLSPAPFTGSGARSASPRPPCSSPGVLIVLLSNRADVRSSLSVRRLGFQGQPALRQATQPAPPSTGARPGRTKRSD